MSEFFSAFFGAFFAFSLNAINAWRISRKKNKEVLLETKFLIEKISIHSKQVIDFINDNHEGNICIQWDRIPRYQHTKPLPELRISELIFLHSYGASGIKVLNNILLVNNEYKTILNIIDERNRLYSKFLDKFEEWEAEYYKAHNAHHAGGNLTGSQLKYICGDKLNKDLGEYTSKLKKLSSNIEEDSSLAMNAIDGFLKSCDKFCCCIKL